MNTDPINVVIDNRRDCQRQADNAPIKVRRPGSLNSIPGTVIDRSDSGLGIIASQCDHTLMPGSAIEILPVTEFASPIRSENAIQATVAWMNITGAGTRLGIRFHQVQESLIAA